MPEAVSERARSSEPAVVEVILLQKRILKLRWLGSKDEADRLVAELKRVAPNSSLIDIADTD